ncbi:hypothetical protein E1J29_16785 [Xanthomonas hortorum pv. vitians]|nr:hypothetical protein BI317_21520 [Xanthomonas hortorum pv. gardneri]NMI18794.1 hypothetical protein [Xanthomonas hortorum pv. vitians]QEW14081.1 hypothetical protein DYQ48_02705 [Xanthomonas hortorum]NMI26202.1 hypothetical protein [Xanthomonas hortorum pv. vitians]NMI32146.1 hypothetical protein [Xanthomonas hortorum pv. vitians]
MTSHNANGPSRSEIWSNQWKYGYPRCESGFQQTKSVRLGSTNADLIGSGKFNVTGEWIC